MIGAIFFGIKGFPLDRMPHAVMLVAILCAYIEHRYIYCAGYIACMIVMETK